MPSSQSDRTSSYTITQQELLQQKFQGERTMNMKNSMKDFFAVPFNIILVVILILIGTTVLLVDSYSSTETIPTEELTVHFFHLPTCPHCTEQKPVFAQVKATVDEVTFIDHDASTVEGSQLFHKLAEEAGLDTTRLGVPTIFVGKQALVGFHTKEQLLSAIDECIHECTEERTIITHEQQGLETSFSEFELPVLGRVDLTAWSLPALAIILGLVDGFNPCALWVLIFLITLLLGQKSKKKIWLVVGSFVLASAISYFLFMTAWLNMFLLIGYIKIITLLIGLFALGMGTLQLKEYFTTKGDLQCKVTDQQSKKKTMDKIRNIIAQPITISMIVAVIGLAFVVNAVEFVCSAAIPAVFTQLLALSTISTVQHYMYILLYVFFYMLDHIIIFSMAAFAIGSGFGQKYAKVCKLIGGIIMLVLGGIMVFAPELLR
jgi:glutaredoxin